MKHFPLILFLVLSSWQCSRLPFTRVSPEKAIATEFLAVQIEESLRKPTLKNSEIGVLTFVDLNRFDEAAPLGRYLQESLMHNLFTMGYRVVEIRLGKEILHVPATGEIQLTRLRDSLRDAGHADLKAVLLGTYIQAGHKLYVTSRLVELENGQVKADGAIYIPLGGHLDHLYTPPQDETESAGKPAADDHEVYERFPASQPTAPAKAPKKKT